MRALVLSLVLVCLACGPQKVAIKTPPPAPPDPWSVTWTDPNSRDPALLWNGLIGVRIGRMGFRAEENGGKTAFEFARYEQGGEEKIQPVENPVGLRFADVAPGGYEQTLDYKTGILTTRFRLESGLSVTARQVMHPTEAIMSEEWKLKGKPGKEFRARTGQAAASTFVSDYILGSMSGIVYRGLPPVIEYFTQSGGEATIDLGHWLPPNPRDWSFRTVSSDAERVWAKRWETDIEIDGPVEDQQAIRSFLFYLRCAIHPAAGMSISPFGLSNTQYNGHVFWDADTWVFPALAFIDPQAAAAIPKYRLKHAEVVEGQLRFPWESSVSGKEVAPGQMSEEIHITGSVLQSLAQAKALGLIKEDIEPLKRAAANFYRKRGVIRDGKLHLENVISPDEFHTGNNDLYTNMLADWLLKGNPPVYLPRDDRSFLTYDNDALRGYKQTAALLSVYPLQHPEAEAQARVMMERFAGKTTPSGPAMSDSIHALIWARLGESEKAYAEWRKSWYDFTRNPLLLFSEKRKKAVTYFTTGAAGCLQTVIYGFLGFRIDMGPPKAGSQWSKRLNGDAWLTIRPNLPKSWKSVTFKNFTVLGERYTLTATHDNVTVSQGEP